VSDYPDTIIRKAAESAHADLCGCTGSGDYWADPTYGYVRVARAVLDAIAEDLGQHVAAKITAHADEHGPGAQDGLGGLARSRWLRYFRIAARIAAFAFLAEEDVMRIAAEALATGQYVACPVPEEEA
jgi:hypothetical protein